MAFTPPDIDVTWQHLPLLTELWTAYCKRQSLLAAHNGPDAIDEPAAGTVVEDFILALQTALTSSQIRLYAVDPDSTFTDIEAEMSYPSPYGSLSALYAAAGIPEGLRRVTYGSGPPTDWEDYDDSSYAYGLIQAGDMLGPWLFADLQSLFSALTTFSFETAWPGGGDVAQGSDYKTGSPPDDYPSGSPVYDDEDTSSTYFSYKEGLWVTSASIAWAWVHARPILGLTDAGDKAKSATIYGRTARFGVGGDYWPVYGAANVYTHELGSISSTTSAELTIQPGGSQFGAWSEIFSLPGTYNPNNLGFDDASAQVYDVAVVVVVSD